MVWKKEWTCCFSCQQKLKACYDYSEMYSFTQFRTYCLYFTKHTTTTLLNILLLIQNIAQSMCRQKCSISNIFRNNQNSQKLAIIKILQPQYKQYQTIIYTANMLPDTITITISIWHICFNSNLFGGNMAISPLFCPILHALAFFVGPYCSPMGGALSSRFSLQASHLRTRSIVSIGTHDWAGGITTRKRSLVSVMVGECSLFTFNEYNRCLTLRSDGSTPPW